MTAMSMIVCEDVGYLEILRGVLRIFVVPDDYCNKIEDRSINEFSQRPLRSG